MAATPVAVAEKLPELPVAVAVAEKLPELPVAVAEKLPELPVDDDEWADAAPDLKKNLSLLSPDQVAYAKLLLTEGQSHLFLHWSEPGVQDEKKINFFNQVFLLNASYPGGLISYIQKARHLLESSKSGKSPYDGFKPAVPTGEVLVYGDDNFMMLEEVGVKDARNAAFVLVSGGLGERLGYKGIKLALPSETSSGVCFLQLYVESILALQEASSGQCQVDIPLIIMTSVDTHAATLQLLKSNSYFGMKSSQVTLLKQQENVACLEDNDARVALDPNDKYKIQTKPHGHGDIHALLYASGLLTQWKNYGIRWVLFFQDTNGLVFKAIPASLGISCTKSYHVNSLSVPRKAKEAMGAITRLTDKDGRTMVINVEYNQLDPLLRATGYPDGDINCKTGFSPFPGNINQLTLDLDSYIKELTKTKGAISEFVNPKYKDSSKTSFKSSTRLECMMQDFPKTLPPTAKVGFTVMDDCLAYAPVKNNPIDAAKVPKGNSYHSATSGEMAIYRANCCILKKVGVQIADPIVEVFNGQEVEVWPRITWSPKWGLTCSDVKKKVAGSCFISQNSSLTIIGKNVLLEDLSLDGALLVRSVDDAEVKLSGNIKNKGCFVKPVHYKDPNETEEVRIRGFKMEKIDQLELNYRERGNFSYRPEE